MEANPFSPDLFRELQNRTEEIIKKTPVPHYAAFDADGTLWNEDLGEQFFQYQIDHCQLPSLENTDPWDYYLTTKNTDPLKAYLWLAQINAGQSLCQVRIWAKKACEQEKTQVFESQKKWINWLKGKNVRIFIVTASIKWAVEPMAHKLGVDFDQILGIKTRIDNKGLVTDKQEGPLTWREGKALALLSHTRNIRPVFCCGNTYGDIDLLETSLGDRLCIQTQTKKNSLYEEEKRLKSYAEKKDWRVHHFFKI